MFRGDRLIALMEERNVSQSELARRVGVSQATIWKLTKEPAQGSKHTHKIARELETSPDYLMGETDDPSLGEAPAAAAELHLVTMQVALPSEAALARMFHAMLDPLEHGDMSKAELADTLARRLPIGLASLRDVSPARRQGASREDGEAPRSRAKSDRASRPERRT